MRKKPALEVCSFFSGAGLMDLGFESAGFDVVWVNEVYKPFMNAYAYARDGMGIQPPAYGYHNASIDNPSTHTQVAAILSDADKRASLTGFIGGPPCPDFSVAGKNRGQYGDNGRLSVSYADLIVKHQPDFFVFENVKGLYRTKNHRAFFDGMKKGLEKHYVCYERLINAVEYGVAQDRQRIILVGFHKRHVYANSIEWTQYTQYPTDVIKRYTWPTTSNSGIDTHAPYNLTVDYWFRRNNVDQHPNAKHHFQPRSGLSKFHTLLEGDVSRKSYKRLHRYRYSPTAAYGHNEVHIHPYLPRRISAAEAMAIQSLPESFVLPHSMSLTDMFKTIGNGVPYLAARGVARSIYDVLSSCID